ncbi:MAG: ATP-binding protein [Chitinophagales bacterium]
MNATNIDSLQSLIIEYEQDQVKDKLMTIHHEMGDYYYGEKAYQKAIDSYNLSLEFARKLDQSTFTIDNLYKIGRMSILLQNSTDAIEVLSEAYELAISEPTPDLTKIGKIANYLSKTYKEIGNLELAYQYRLKALQIFEELQDSSNIAASKFELGNIFFYQNQYKTAIQYYKQSWELALQVHIVGLEMASIGSIGSAYDRLEQTEKSLEYNLLALKIAEENNLESQQADALHNVASNYHSLGECNKALDFYKKSLSYKQKHENKFGEVGTLRAISSVYLDMGYNSLALQYLKEALKIAEEIDSDTRRIDVYQRLALAYEQSGKPTEACTYMKAYMALKDSVMNQNTLEAMAQAKTRYEVDKREREITFLKKENEVLGKNREITSLRMMALVGLVLGLVLLLLIAAFYYGSQKRYNKLLEEKTAHIAIQNSQLEKMNKQLEDVNQSQKTFNHVLAAKNQQIELQNKQLENTNEELKQFAYVASHDLKEPLRMIGSYTSLIKRRYTKHLDEGAQEFMGYITDATNRMNNLLEDLLSYSRINTHNQQKESINIHEVIEGVLANLHLDIQQKNAQIRIHELPKISANRSQMSQLFQNLVSNALKFSDSEHPEIEISAQTNGKMHVFSVKDNGIGIDPEYQQKIFEMFSRLHTRQEYEGTGIGLATCKKIVERHGGIIWVESEKHKGCTFYFTLPYDNKMTNHVESSSSLEKAI